MLSFKLRLQSRAPSLKKWLNRSDGRPGDVKVAASLLDPNLDRLCDTCSLIQFQCHNASQCEGLRCNFRQFQPADGFVPDAGMHSIAYYHQKSYQALEESSHGGCHLCTIFRAGLEQVWDSLDNLELGVLIFWTQIGTGRTFGADRLEHAYEWEELQVICGSRSAVFEMTDVPVSDCRKLSSKNIGSRAVPPVTEPLWIAGCIKYANEATRSEPTFQALSQENSFLHGYRPGSFLNIISKKDSLLLASTFAYGTSQPQTGWIPGENVLRLLKPPHLKCRCGKGVFEPPLLFRGSPPRTAYIDPNPISAQLLLQIKQWIEFCTTRHYYCRTPQDSPLPLRVIDVGPPNGETGPFLSVGSDRKGIYATLSYRWGDAPTFRTTTSNIQTLQEKIPLESLPMTLQDAITVTRLLSLRYLWIDALCILQDNKLDWQQQSAIMHEIYGNAWINISADRALNSDSGFLSNRNALELRSCALPNAFGPSQSGKIICPRIPSAHVAIEEGILATRGWICQERLLSKRILHFGQYEVSWECTEWGASEQQPVSSENIFKNESIWKSTLAGRTLERLEHPILRDSHDFSLWYKQVRAYSGTSLTKPEDKLPAIAGVARVFQAAKDPPLNYVAGLWREDLMSGLSWRLEEYSDGTMDQSERPVTTYRAPSFSWASVDGIVEWEELVDRNVAIPGSQAEVLDVEIIPAGADALGQVAGGWLKLRGFAITHNELFQHRDGFEPIIWFNDPHFKRGSTFKQRISKLIYFRLQEMRNPESEYYQFSLLSCLVLSPTAKNRNEYRRVGYFSTASHKRDLSASANWIKKVVTII